MSYHGNKSTNRSALDQHALQIVRAMKKCSRVCPAFILCPLMPLAVQPKKDTERICLVNCGDDRMKVAYYKMFVGGQDGVIEMMQVTIMEYGKVLQDAKLTPKDRLRALEKFNIMLDKLHQKMVKKSLPGSQKGSSDDDEMDEVVLIASKNDPKPDPESLEHSPMLDSLIQSENTLYERKPQEVDLGKELIDKFFPEEE
jgi:hypothetical protein